MHDSLGYTAILIVFFLSWITGCQSVEQLIEPPKASVSRVASVTPKVARKRVQKAQKIIMATVLDENDGDTMTVQYQDEKMRIRLHAVDSPEYSETKHDFRQPWGLEARNYIRKMCKPGSEIKLVLGAKSYDRWVADVYKGDVWVNAEMVKSGLAWVDPRYSKDSELLGYLDGAKKARKGIWSQANPESPWKFRERMKKK